MSNTNFSQDQTKLLVETLRDLAVEWEQLGQSLLKRGKALPDLAQGNYLIGQGLAYCRAATAIQLVANKNVIPLKVEESRAISAAKGVLSATNSLKPLLYDLVYRAQTHPGITQHISLDTGLLVEVVQIEAEIVLRISREGQFPSQEEYGLIMGSWPHEEKPKSPKEIDLGSRKYLQSTWPARPLPEF